MTQRNYFILGALEAFVALVWLISIPGEAEAAWLLGLSQRRWLMLIPVIFVLMFFVWNSFISIRKPNRRSLFISALSNPKYQFFFIFLVVTMLVYAMVGFVIVTKDFSSETISAYIERLAPLLFLVMVLGVQTLLYITTADKDRHSEKKQATEGEVPEIGFGYKEIIRSKIDVFTILLLGIAAGIFMWMPVSEILAFGGASDHNEHIRFAVETLENQTPSVSHFLYHLLLILGQFIPGVDFYLSAKIVVTLSFSILSVIVYLIIRASIDRVASLKSSIFAFLISFSLLIVSPISLFTMAEGNYYRGYIGISIYHNPTIILLKPLAIMVFLFTVKVFDERKNLKDYGSYLVAGIVTILSILVKPSYSIALLPGLGLLVVYRLYKKRFINWRFLIFAVIVPSMMVLGWQYYYAFATMVESKIMIAPFELYESLSGDMSWLFPKFILSIAFPLSVYMTDFYNARRDGWLNFSWMVFFVGMFYTYFLVQSGPEMRAGNFWWSGEIALFMLCLLSMRNFIQGVGGVFSSGSAKHRIKVSFVVAIFGLHLISGILFYSNHLNITSLLIK